MSATHGDEWVQSMAEQGLPGEEFLQLYQEKLKRYEGKVKTPGGALEAVVK